MRTMCKTSIVPFAATCALFAALGWVFGENMTPVAPPAYLDACYSLDAVTILPAHLENTIVLMAVLVPWSTAVVVPLAAIGAPLTCILAAFYLYLVPLWNACTALVSRHAQNMAAKGRAARCS